MTRSSNNWHTRRAATLIEVLAGLLILATSLVGLLVAKARHTRQWATAQRQLDATAVAEELLAAWWQDPKGLPRRDAGPIPGRGDLTWRTSVVTNDATQRLRMEVVRLDILGTGCDGDSNDENAPPALASVDLVLPESPPSGNLAASPAGVAPP